MTLGLREADGYFTLKGRSKDLIISGGYNVYPPEVELVLADHPAVAASAVIGCPDAEWGERVVAVVMPHAGRRDDTCRRSSPSAVRGWLTTRPRARCSLSTRCRATLWARSRRRNCVTSSAADAIDPCVGIGEYRNRESCSETVQREHADERMSSHDERMLRLLDYIPQRRIGVFDHLRPQRWNWYLVRRPMERSLERQTPEPLTIRQTRNLRLFWLDGIFAATSESFYLAFIPIFALAYGATNQQVGWITAVGNLAGATALFPGARLMEKTGKRKAIVVWTGGGIARLMLLLLALVPLFQLPPEIAILTIAALNGVRAFMANFGNPAWTAMVADIVPDFMRGRYFSTRNLTMGMATLIFCRRGRLDYPHGQPVAVRSVSGLSVQLLTGLSLRHGEHLAIRPPARAAHSTRMPTSCASPAACAMPSRAAPAISAL